MSEIFASAVLRVSWKPVVGWRNRVIITFIKSLLSYRIKSLLLSRVFISHNHHWQFCGSFQRHNLVGNIVFFVMTIPTSSRSMNCLFCSESLEKKNCLRGGVSALAILAQLLEVSTEGDKKTKVGTKSLRIQKV